MRQADLTVKIKVAHDASDQLFGAPPILADLREAGDDISHKTFAPLMRENEIPGTSPRPGQPKTTIADATRPPAPRPERFSMPITAVTTPPAN